MRTRKVFAEADLAAEAVDKADAVDDHARLEVRSMSAHASSVLEVRRGSLFAACAVAAAFAACSSSNADSTSASSSAAASSGAGGAGGAAEVPAIATCVYVNPFSKGNECKKYTGSGWSVATATTDCGNVVAGVAGSFAEGNDCGFAELLGSCSVTKDGGLDYVLESEGGDASKCDGAKLGCEVFAKGKFTVGATCDGTTTSSSSGSSSGGYGSVPFVQPYQTCKDPLPGEPAGQSAGGKVCTWTLISGCTEAGRHYEDYASCSDVLTQRPYYATMPAGETMAGDARLNDTAYMTEIAWAKEQVAASACVCCHSKQAPSGASQWSIDATGIWLDQVADTGIAMMAGLAPSDALGAFPAGENTGFDRTTLGIPTTDILRMQTLMVGEWMRRGYTIDDAKKVPAFGGPLVDQQTFVPSACKAGEGIDAAGNITWSGGEARYLYVLTPGSKNPGVPPNMDEPTGTQWLTDVPSKAAAFMSGVKYGDVSGGRTQRIPASGAPAALVSGQTYYVYVLRDIGFPITRCTTVMP